MPVADRDAVEAIALKHGLSIAWEKAGCRADRIAYSLKGEAKAIRSFGKDLQRLFAGREE